MNLKDVSIQSEYLEIYEAVTEDSWFDSGQNKSDTFLIADFRENIGKCVELQRNSDGTYFDGTLESVKVDVEPLINNNSDSVLYLIKFKEYDEIFKIKATMIEYNTNYLKKYYFHLDGTIKWRIVFR